MQSHESHCSSSQNKVIFWLLEEKGIGSTTLRMMDIANTVGRDIDASDVTW